MKIETDKGVIRGDLIFSSVLRYDITPVPSTFEASIMFDSQIAKSLANGRVINVNGFDYRIVKSDKKRTGDIQGLNEINVMSIICQLDSHHKISIARRVAIIKESTALSSIYRASGCSVSHVVNDIRIPRFSCFVGDTPSLFILAALQEAGGIMSWKKGRSRFQSIDQAMTQKEKYVLPDNTLQGGLSNLVERHSIPNYYSIDDKGEVVYGARSNPRTTRFSPHKTSSTVNRMSGVITQRAVIETGLSLDLYAGDIMGFTNSKPLLIVTAAHVFSAGSGDNGQQQYTKLWLGSPS